MRPITYLIGDATKPHGCGRPMIIHVSNSVGGWGRGFVLALSKVDPTPEWLFRQCWSRKRNHQLGDVQFGAFIPESEPSRRYWFANMVAQEGVGQKNGPPIRYQALETCLEKVAAACKRLENVEVHAPRFGCGLAGGDWQGVEPLIIKTLCNRDIPVYIYDLG